MAGPFFPGELVVFNGWCENSGKRVPRHCGIVGKIVTNKGTKAHKYIAGVSRKNFIKFFTDDKGYILKEEHLPGQPDASPESWRDSYIEEISHPCTLGSTYPIECNDSELVTIVEYCDMVYEAFNALHTVFDNLYKE